MIEVNYHRRRAEASSIEPSVKSIAPSPAATTPGVPNPEANKTPAQLPLSNPMPFEEVEHQQHKISRETFSKPTNR